MALPQATNKDYRLATRRLRIYPRVTHDTPADDLGLNCDPDVLTLQIGRHDPFPMTLTTGQELFLGRVSPRDTAQYYIDLTDYDGVALGTSRRHAVIGHDENQWWIEDLNSSNGTWLNGQRLAPGVPAHLDVKNRILLANLEFNVYLPHKIIFGAAVPIYADTTKPIRVVHIEPEPVLREIVSVVLHEAHGCIDLRQFATGRDALLYLANNAYTVDLFVMSIPLAGSMNGIQIAQQLRAYECPGRIVLTAVEATPSLDLLDSLTCEFYPTPNYIWEVAARLFNYRLDRIRASEVDGNTGPCPVVVVPPQVEVAPSNNIPRNTPAVHPAEAPQAATPAVPLHRQPARQTLEVSVCVPEQPPAPVPASLDEPALPFHSQPTPTRRSILERVIHAIKYH
ncbi:MAG: FHA domain-containing protein [Anaerolineae bacterium]|nr:FHA domain-containing protein [Anaerolineae bacterium]